ncbi:MAG: radical SAM protein [Candidatus Omnitrophica bacterium]|nr:radical SAM protein [Candidatus Omnitrophota bacterium]
MRIALVFPKYTHKDFSENLKIVNEEFCFAPPIILAYVAAILEKYGHEVILLDARALNLSREELLLRLKTFKPDLLGFRAESYHFHDALECIAYLKHNLNIPVFAGGPNLSFYTEETMAYKEIDYGIIGEAIESLPKLIEALQNNKDLNGIEGLAYKQDNEIRVTPVALKPVDFDAFPFPARHLLPSEKYYSFPSQRKNFTIMVTAKGCPYKCSFCAINCLPYSERSAGRVVDEIEECAGKYRIREIDIFDATFFYNRKRDLEIFSQIIKRKIPVEWSCRTRVDLVDDELLGMAYRAGCRRIYYGIESASPEILKSINKGITPEKIKEAIALTRKHKIRTLGFFMFGGPGETKDTIKKTIKFSKELKLDFIQICKTIAKPGSDLNELLKKKAKRDYWSEYISGRNGKSCAPFPAPWTGLTNEELFAYVKKGYMSFYLRPSQILRIIFETKSLEELFRYIIVGTRMVLSYFRRSS